jgi:MFS family permease
VIGMGLGPLLIGLLSDALSLRWALFLPAACAPWAALHGYLASRSLRRDLAQAAA